MTRTLIAAHDGSVSYAQTICAKNDALERVSYFVYIHEEQLI